VENLINWNFEVAFFWDRADDDRVFSVVVSERPKPAEPNTPPVPEFHIGFTPKYQNDVVGSEWSPRFDAISTAKELFEGTKCMSEQHAEEWNKLDVEGEKERNKHQATNGVVSTIKQYNTWPTFHYASVCIQHAVTALTVHATNDEVEFRQLCCIQTVCA